MAFPPGMSPSTPHSADDHLPELFFRVFSFRVAWVFSFRGPLRRDPLLRLENPSGPHRSRGIQEALRVRHLRPIAFIRRQQMLRGMAVGPRLLAIFRRQAELPSGRPLPRA